MQVQLFINMGRFHALHLSIMAYLGARGCRSLSLGRGPVRTSLNEVWSDSSGFASTATHMILAASDCQSGHTCDDEIDS